MWGCKGGEVKGAGRQGVCVREVQAGSSGRRQGNMPWEEKIGPCPALLQRKEEASPSPPTAPECLPHETGHACRPLSVCSHLAQDTQTHTHTSFYSR